jgi:integrase
MQYVAARRAIGYRCEEEARLLRRLDRFLAGQGLTSVELSRELVRQWLAKTPHEHPRTQAARAGLTRQFARFIAERGLPAYVPPPMRMEIARLEFTPYIFTRAEIRALLAAGDRLPATARSPRRHLVMRELFRVLYGCGLRISEALKLTVTDVDLGQGVLLLREAKFRKDRLVAVSPGLSERLRCYAAAVDRARDLGQAFFPNRNGGPYTKWAVYGIFRRLLREAGISHGGRGRGPRLHDVRHTFAVHRLEEWYRQGVNLAAKLPVLSAYMGHQSLVGTQRYLRLTPALFPDVVASVEAVVGHAMPRRER